MYFAVDIGHNAPFADTGAVGIKSEDHLTKEVGNKLVKILKDAGHRVILTCPGASKHVNNSLGARVNMANAAKADLFISIHFNAFNKKAYGTEVFISSWKSKAYKQASDVVDNISKLGFAKRGVKVANFAVIRNTTMPAMLIECCFIDNKRDMDIFDSDKMAVAIASGILGNVVKPTPKNEDISLIATLKVNRQNWLKPSTEQSNQIDKNLIKLIDVGEYSIKLLADEEKHYQILLDGKEWFIYYGAEACELINKKD
jgi:N-acetylmuramoyl-L-alanine amidase